MIYNLHVPTQSTWVLKPNVMIPASEQTYQVRFRSRGTKYSQLRLSANSGGTKIPSIVYGNSAICQGLRATTTANYWIYNEYREITFLGSIPDALLNWLKTNAVKNGALKPVYLWKGYDVDLSISVSSKIDWDNALNLPEDEDDDCEITMYSDLVLGNDGYVTGSGNKVTANIWDFVKDASKYASYFWRIGYAKWYRGIDSYYDIDSESNSFAGYPVIASYSKGSTEKLWIANESSRAYPANGKSGNTWYVRQ